MENTNKTESQTPNQIQNRNTNISSFASRLRSIGDQIERIGDEADRMGHKQLARDIRRLGNEVEHVCDDVSDSENQRNYSPESASATSSPKTSVETQNYNPY